MATDFPEFTFAFAEENFLRGYQLGLDDAERLHIQQTTEIAGTTRLIFILLRGLHVFFKDPLNNEEINPEEVVKQGLKTAIPHHLLSEVEMIIVGVFDEFEERGINAFYDGGTLYVSNIQDDSRLICMMIWFTKSRIL